MKLYKEEMQWWQKKVCKGLCGPFFWLDTRVEPFVCGACAEEEEEDDEE